MCDEPEKPLTPEEAKNKKTFYRSIFEKFDLNKSGHIDSEEFMEMLDKDNDVPRNISSKIFIEGDKNKDDVLEYYEFEKIIETEDYKEVFSKYINIYLRYVVPRKKRVHPVGVDALYEEKYSCWPPPMALFLVTIIEIICFIIDETRNTMNMKGYGPSAEIFIYNPFRRQEIWRFLTYMFVHIGYTHLIVNIIVQLSLGVPLEMVHKSLRVLVVYFSGVIAGSLCTSITDSKTFLAGASGGVYALITAHISTIIMNWNEIEFPLIQLLLFIVIAGVDVGSSIYNRYVLLLQDNIGYAAHFGGALAGLLVGIWNLKNFIPTKKETYLWWCALTIYIIFMGVMILLNFLWTDHFYPMKE